MFADMLKDLRYGARTLTKAPGFSAVVLLTLALGIGANVVVFSVVKAVLLRPLPYDEPDRLVTLWEHSPRRGIGHENTSPLTFAEWRDRSRAFEAMGYWTGGVPFNVVGPGGVEKVTCAYASSGLFPVLRVKPLLGRTFLPNEDQPDCPRVAVISHRYWQTRFAADPKILGKTITVDTYGRREYEIVGVMPPGFDFPNTSQVWLPAGWNGIPRHRRGPWLSVVARLNPQVSIDGTTADINRIQSDLSASFPGSVGTHVAVVPLLTTTVGRDLRLALLVLWGVVGCVLLIACANVANLLLARAASRQKEIAVRLSLGAGRWRVVRQLLTESLLLAVVGGALGALAAGWGLDGLVRLAAGQVPRLDAVRLDATALFFTLLVSLLTGVLFGLAPALQAARPALSDTLKESSRGATDGPRRGRLRSALIVAEIALSLVLLVGAGLMLQSFARLARLDRGIQSQRVLTADLDFSVSGYTTWVQPTPTRPQVTVHALLERLRTQPGVQHVAAANHLPRGAISGRLPAIFIDGQPEAPPGEGPSAAFTAVSPDYFLTLGVPLLRGRPFSESDTFEAQAVAIVNDAFARRYFPGEDPVGRRLAMSGQNGRPTGPNPRAASPWSEIVGVVGDTRRLSARAESVPQVYVPYWQYPMQTPTLLLRTAGESGPLAAAVHAELSALNPNLPPPTFRTLDEILSDATAQPRFQALLLSLFAAVALALAAAGIYAVMAHSVAQRTHELGVRIALGARTADVLALVVGRGLRLALLGVAAGVVAALALTRVMRSLLFEVRPTDPLTFAAVSLLLVLVALLACYLPARRAARVDPMEALRHE